MEVDAEWESAAEFGATISQHGEREGGNKKRIARIKRGTDEKATWEAVERIVRAEKKDAMLRGSDRLEEQKRMELGRAWYEGLSLNQATTDGFNGDSNWNW